MSRRIISFLRWTIAVAALQGVVLLLLAWALPGFSIGSAGAVVVIALVFTIVQAAAWPLIYAIAARFHPLLSFTQAGILLGDNTGIPAYRWNEKATGALMQTGSMSSARELEGRLSQGTGLLVHGASRWNVFSGDAPDVLVISHYDPDTGEVASFEEQVGSHGGLGGTQTCPFLLHPTSSDPGINPIVGAGKLHRLLKGWRTSTAGGINS